MRHYVSLFISSKLSVSSSSVSSPLQKNIKMSMSLSIFYIILLLLIFSCQNVTSFSRYSSTLPFTPFSHYHNTKQQQHHHQQQRSCNNYRYASSSSSSNLKFSKCDTQSTLPPFWQCQHQKRNRPYSSQSTLFAMLPFLDMDATTTMTAATSFFHENAMTLSSSSSSTSVLSNLWMDIQSSLSTNFIEAITSSTMSIANSDAVVMSAETATTAAVTATATAANDFDALGRDVFIFLAASVVVVPTCKNLKISPVLGFLIVGCLIGPYGMFTLFSNTEGDIQLGDLGILFLLFTEGLALSPERIKELGKFTGLGVFQLLISIGLIFVGTFWGGPVILQYVQEIGIPSLDLKLFKPVVDNPVQSFVIAAASALSSSAFVLPVLKQKGWEERPEGIAGLSILLLQDLAVAPLLVIIPLLAGSGPSSSIELGILVAKATLGFGVVLAAGSYILRFVFDVVAATRSTETFVAAALLVAVGMGQAADFLGLSASTGAFAAGVLLAGNKYRPQIQADIKPFEGILLGIFFMTAGAELDPSVVITEWPVLLAGITSFILIKAAIIFASGPALGLTKGQAARVSLTLAGGGEFAFVLFQLAQGLGVIPNQLAKVLTASVVISMSLTPLLGELATYAGNVIDEATGGEGGLDGGGLTREKEAALFDQIDTDKSGTISLDELRDVLVKLKYPYTSIADVFSLFDTDGNGFIDRDEWSRGIASGLLAECLSKDSTEALRTEVTFQDDALVIVGFGEVGKSIYNLLDQTGQFWKGRVVCLDFNPSRVTAGVLEGAPVVFGDGAKMELLKAVGVTRPMAVIIALASDRRRLDATMRLRASLPEDTPIYVFEGNSRMGDVLIRAGATEVISQTTETILRFGALLGACATDEEMCRLRQLCLCGNNNSKTSKSTKTRVNGNSDSNNDNNNNNGQGEMVLPSSSSLPSSTLPYYGLSDGALMDLAEEIGVTQRELTETWENFDSIAGDRETIPISELKEMMMRRALDGPSDGEAFERSLINEDRDRKGELTFAEYAKAVLKRCGQRDF